MLPTEPIQRAEVVGQGVAVNSDGHTCTLPAEWLRDNCRCDRCRIVQTDERRYRMWEADTPVVSGVSARGGALTVDWADGHRSVFTPADFEAIEVAAGRGRHVPRPWRGDHQICRVDHGAALGDPAQHQRMFEALRDDGVVLLTGSPTEPGSIIDTCRSLGLALVDTSLGFIFDVMLDPVGFNVAYTAEALAPHNDNSQFQYPPSGQVLAMIRNDANGGDSVVVDGFAVLEALQRDDPAAVDVLSRVLVGFRQYSTDADSHWRSPIVVRSPEGGFLRLRFSNQLRQPLDPDHPDLAEWYRAYRRLARLVCDPAFAVTFRLNAGDSLFVHGDRVLHARTAFTPDGPRHLQDVYFTIDDVHARLDRMTGVARDAMGSSANATPVAGT